MKRWFQAYSAGIISSFITSAALAAAPPELLTTMSLEELMNLEILSVSKKMETAVEAAAAVTVITQEDIHRSGATTIAEALRMAPGMNVARINSNQWAVSARGFNGLFANKLLVLIDGRSVYTPLFSGVFWDVQDTLLEDIDRIEVVRGPGAAVWGSNAVNGVVNVITKSAKDTQGALLSSGGGIEEEIFGQARYGGQAGETVFYRVYTKYFERDAFVAADQGETYDEWDILRGGFRLDWLADAEDSVTIQGDIYGGDVGHKLDIIGHTPPFFSTAQRASQDVGGGNVLARWTHEISETSNFELKANYDRTERRTLVIDEIRDTLDVDFQHMFELIAHHNVTWGLGYRVTRDDIDNSAVMIFNPQSRTDQLFSAFIQDDFPVFCDEMRLTLGSKFEHNDYTDFEVQPGARLLWTPHERHTVWGAVSHAVRTPSRFEHDMRFLYAAVPEGPDPAMLFSLVGNDAFESEKLFAYELGYRVQPADVLSVDVAVFYNVYEDLQTYNALPPELNLEDVPHLHVDQVAGNNMDGESYGAEVSAHWTPLPSWRLAAGYTFLRLHLHLDEGFQSSDEAAEGDSPRNQFHMRSFLNLPGNLQFDTAWYYVDRLPNQDIAGYQRIDLRFGWRSPQDVEFSLVVQNLLDNDHPEFGRGILQTPARIERTAYGKITWRF